MAMATTMVTPMNLPKNNDRKTGSKTERIVALALAATTVAAGYLWIATQREFDRLDRDAPTIFADPRANGADARGIAARQKRELAWQPLSQNALNRLLVAARLSGQTATAEKVAAVMREFAWRTAPGQLNLITIAIEQRRFDQVFQHADALTRREKAVEEVLAIFSLYEQVPVQRGYLIAALKKSPPWRKAFLASAERLNTPSQVQARYATISALLTAGTIDRDELSSLLVRMVAIGSTKEAYALWRKVERPAVTPDALFDPEFTHAATLQKSGTAIRFPFEWQFDSGSAAGAQLIEHDDRNELQLYWNGQGVPIFARQTFKARPAIYRLTLAGVEASDAQKKMLGAELVCPRIEGVRMLPAKAGRKGEIAYLAERATACEFPELRLYASADSERVDFELSLASIKLRPAN